MRKTFGLIILLIYVTILSTFAVAELLYQSNKNQGEIEMLKMAAVLNPFVSDYRQAIFEQSKPKEMNSIQEAIRLEPFKASYHMFYALELLKNRHTRTRSSDQMAYREIEKAYQLKPYSVLYRNIYEKYAQPYLIK